MLIKPVMTTDVADAEHGGRRDSTASTAEKDENRLAQFGYKQELRRDWGLAHNFGVSFSIIVGGPPVPGMPGYD